MDRRPLIAAAAALALLAGCQDYNFNPVGKCVVQAGAARVHLDSLATADVLFVVDDSGSMGSKQANLAANFAAFIDAVAQTEADRKNAGLVPLEFHIAVTTSSIFEGQLSGNGSTCTNGTCNVVSPVPPTTYQYACTPEAAKCNDLRQKYNFSANQGCSAGVGTDLATYPQGNFVAAPGNHAVLHFTKDLKWETWNTANVDPAISALVAAFQANINVGTCGSGMEQHLEAGRLAVQKALAGQQPGITSDEWPHPGAKMVVAWVGDEDDCSNPNDPNKALVFTAGLNSPGNDVCTQDEALPAAQRRMFPVDGVNGYVSYFSSLGRAFGAAFIFSASACTTDANGVTTCTPGTCTGCSGSCNGFAAGNRFRALSAGLRSAGFSTVEDTVCDSNFSNTLKGIADLVKPPAGLTLPSLPAASQVAVLRIESTDGSSSRECTGPAVTPAGAATSDWWFVDCASQQTPPPVSPVPTKCIFINANTKHCVANPGETYVADYLGLIPQPSASNPQGGCLAPSDCQAALGGIDTDWKCVLPPSGGGARGTCVCK